MVLLEILQNSQENTCAGVFFASWRPSTLLKKRLWHRCFPVDFAKLFKNTFFTKHPRRLPFRKKSQPLFSITLATHYADPMLLYGYILITHNVNYVKNSYAAVKLAQLTFILLNLTKLMSYLRLILYWINLIWLLVRT